MARIVDVELPTGEIIRAEIASESGGDVGVAEMLKLAAVHNTIRSVANWVKTDVLDAAAADRLSVQFGVKLGVESGELIGFLGKGVADATLSVTLEWDSHQ